VNTDATFPLSRQRWLKKPILARSYHAWLVDNGSLTRRLQQRYTAFSVQPVTVKLTKPNLDEQACMRHSRHQRAWIRDVMLMGNEQRVVYAHSVLPKASLRGAWASLGKLGSKPLGAMLFANPKVKRTQFRYKKLSANHALYQQAVRQLHVIPTALWARRSIFSLNSTNQSRQSIMITEVFLPDLLRWPCKTT
jgi:chorismate lyase